MGSLDVTSRMLQSLISHKNLIVYIPHPHQPWVEFSSFNSLAFCLHRPFHALPQDPFWLFASPIGFKPTKGNAPSDVLMTKAESVLNNSVGYSSGSPNVLHSYIPCSAAVLLADVFYDVMNMDLLSCPLC